MKRSAQYGFTGVLLFPSCTGRGACADDRRPVCDATLQRVDLVLHSADWAKLRAKFQTNTYYPADLTLNGQTVRNVGIRSRGRGSRKLEQARAACRLRPLHHGQRFLGLKSFVLDNLTQDRPACTRRSRWRFTRARHSRAARHSHAALRQYEYAGLYAIVESVDKEMLARVFGAIGDDTQNDGYLYEFKWLDDWKFGYLGDGLIR